MGPRVRGKDIVAPRSGRPKYPGSFALGLGLLALEPAGLGIDLTLVAVEFEGLHGAAGFGDLVGGLLRELAGKVPLLVEAEHIDNPAFHGTWFPSSWGVSRSSATRTK